MRFLIALLFCASAAPALADVQVENAWMRATPPGATIAAGYLVVRNPDATADRLVSITSTAAARVETHITRRDGDITRMREVKGYAVPANGRLELKPGGSHLMFVDIRRPFKEGDRIPAVLRFRNAGEVRIEFQVTGLAGKPAHQHRH